MMKKEDFKYGAEKYYIDDEYILDCEDYLLTIDEKIFDDETIKYANEIIEKYKKEKENIIESMLNNRLRDFYNRIYNYTDEYIKENIGRPRINIISRKDDKHPNWKFEYAGVIEYCETKLDEHIISIEFIDDLDIDDYVQMDG